MRIPATLRCCAPPGALTEHTDTDVDDLLRGLERVRRQGCAVTVGTRHPDVAAVGAAILSGPEPQVATLSLSLPAQRFPRRMWPVYGEHVARAAAECSVHLGWDPAS